jgi:hypothetical protein
MNAISVPNFWLEVFLIVIMALLPRFLVQYLFRTYFPSHLRIAYELERFDKTGNISIPETELSEAASILSSPHRNHI